jgi:hypothetical protein
MWPYPARSGLGRYRGFHLGMKSGGRSCRYGLFLYKSLIMFILSLATSTIFILFRKTKPEVRYCRYAGKARITVCKMQKLQVASIKRHIERYFIHTSISCLFCLVTESPRSKLKLYFCDEKKRGFGLKFCAWVVRAVTKNKPARVILNIFIKVSSWKFFTKLGPWWQNRFL